jgi:biopolymer transport protein ExbD
MSRSRPKRDVEEAKMDMTPIIDVVFNLLIFFMLTMNFPKEEGLLLAYLPKDQGLSQSQVQQKELEEIRVSISKASKEAKAVIRIGNTTVPDPEIDSTPLISRLKGLMGSNSETPVIIDPSRLAEFKYVIYVLNACKTAGVREIKFAGKPTH